MFTGCKSYEAIAQFGRDKGFALAHALGFTRGKTPCKSTLSVLFRALDAAAFKDRDRERPDIGDQVPLGVLGIDR